MKIQSKETKMSVPAYSIEHFKQYMFDKNFTFEVSISPVYTENWTSAHRVCKRPIKITLQAHKVPYLLDLIYYDLSLENRGKLTNAIRHLHRLRDDAYIDDEVPEEVMH